MAPHLRIVPPPDASADKNNGPEVSTLTHVQRLLVESALPLVEPCATAVARGYPGLVTRDELLGPGTIGLHRAAVIYEEDRYPDFKIFAYHHIRWEMLDSISTEHFSQRARVERAMERSFEHFASHQTLEVDLFMDSDQTVEDAANRSTDEALAAAFLAGMIEAQAQSPEDSALAAEARSLAVETLKEAVASLYKHEREVVHLVYEQGMTLGEVARTLKVSLPTIKNRHKASLRKLRAFFVKQDHGLRMWPPLDAPSA